MKRRLNILCLVVMLVLSYSVLEQGYYIFLGAKMGAQTGLELGKKGSDIAAYKELMNLKVVNLIPSSMESFDFFRDSVYNEKSRSYVPAAYSSLMVSVDSHDSVGKVVAKYLLIYLHLGFSLWAVVLFIRLIISINKSDIFNWRNVRRLRRLGMALVVSFCCTFASSYLDFIGIDTVFSLHGYELSLSELVSTTTLVLGLCSLIVGEVFAIGLKMKEEQDFDDLIIRRTDRDMNKIRVCAFLALVVFIGSVVTDMFSGFMDGWNEAGDQKDFHALPSVSLLVRADDTLPADTLISAAQDTPMYCNTSEVSVQGFRSTKWRWVSFLLFPAGLFALYGFYSVARLVLTATKGEVFVHKNVRRMRIFVYALISVSLLFELQQWGIYHDLASQVRLEGYEVLPYSFKYAWFNYMLLALFTEIFAIGVKIKEEQDLTV